MKSIFKQLEEKEICYAVGVSFTRFKAADDGLSKKQYFLLTKRTPEARELKFRHVKDYPKHLQRDLTPKEILEFRENQEKYIRVVHNMHGRIYELKNNSLRNQ